MSSGGSGASGFGTTQSLYDALDPGNLMGKSSSSVLGNIIDPGNVMGNNPQLNGMGPSQNGVPSVLPNLGARSMMPIQPYGKFMGPNTSGGGFNAMAASAAGPLFDPSAGAPSWQALMAAMGRAGSSGGAAQPTTRSQPTLPSRRIQP